MEWFVGEIGDAVAKAKSTGGCLVVFIENSDESSKRLEAMFGHEFIYKVLNGPQFVVLRFKQDSEAYVHFSRIYRLVPVPSIFFIGQNGAPIEIATSLLKSAEELRSKINNVINVIENERIPTETATATETAAETSSTSSAAAQPTECPGGVCSLPQSTVKQSAEPAKPKPVKKDEESELRRQREIHFKAMQEKIRRDKLAEQEVRERVRAQIAADRREQARSRSNNLLMAQQEQQSADVENVTLNANLTQNVRLQFRLPNGETSMHGFEPNDEFCIVRAYVRDQVLSKGQQNFALATSYPKRELGADCDDKTLRELGLCPSAVILVLLQLAHVEGGAVRERFDSMFTVLYNVLLAIVNPFFKAAMYVRNAIFGTIPQQAANAQAKKDDDFSASNLDASMRRRAMGGAPESANDATARRWAGGSNIHRLRDQSQKDDDDNATWNGNSTQQQ